MKTFSFSPSDKRRIAFSLLFYCCTFIVDDSPFTSFWDYLPDVQTERAFCAEEQEESLPVVTFLKIRAKNAPSPRASFYALPEILVSPKYGRKNFSTVYAVATSLASRQDLSVSYCTFRI